MNKKLSILIPTLEEREPLYKNMVRILAMQSNQDLVEVLGNPDNGEKTIGQKRNELLQMAKGEYVVFVDDDDMLSPFYVAGILLALKDNPDCCGIEGMICDKAIGIRKFVHSVTIKEWIEKDEVYYRSPNHLNPIKRELALQAKFPEISYGEDHDYSKQIQSLLKTEVYIKGPMYFYYPSSNKMK